MRSIKSKILSIYVFLIFLIFFVAVISIYDLYRLNKAVDGIIASNYKSIVAARNMLDAIERQDSYELIYIQVENEDSIKSFYENQNEFISWLSKAEDNITENDERKVLDKITNNYMQYTELYLKLQQIKTNSGINDANTFYKNNIYPQFLAVKKTCAELLEVNETAMFNSKAKAKKEASDNMYVILMISIFSIFLGLGVAIIFTKKIIKPMNNLIIGIKSIKEGNLHQEINVSTKDEIGELALEFNNMTNRLIVYEKSNVNSLIAEKNKSLAIVKSISDPIIVTDNNYKLILVNNSAESVFNIIEEKAIGRHILETMNHISIFRCIKQITEGNENLEKSQVLSVETEGKTNYYLHHAAPIYDSERKIIGVVTVFQDITVLKEVEQMKTDFIANISHELRTPLTSLILGTELLFSDAVGKLNYDQREIIEAMDEDSKQMMSLINDLLDLSRIEAGKISMNYTSIELEKLLIQSIKPFMDIAKSKGIKLCYNIEDNLPKIRIDMDKITCVMNNLITNAIKFVKRGDTINIHASKEPDRIKIVVHDTGQAIPEDYKEIIFERFIQIQDKFPSESGIGLGLSIAKEFVIRHGGSIWLESNIRYGNKFIFTLPL